MSSGNMSIPSIGSMSLIWWQRKWLTITILNKNISFHKQVSFKRYLVNTVTLNTYQAWSGLGEQVRLMDIVYNVFVCVHVQKCVYFQRQFPVAIVQLLNLFLFCFLFYLKHLHLPVCLCVCYGGIWAKYRRRDGKAAGDTSPGVWKLHEGECTHTQMQTFVEYNNKYAQARLYEHLFLRHIMLLSSPSSSFLPSLFHICFCLLPSYSAHLPLLSPLCPNLVYVYFFFTSFSFISFLWSTPKLLPFLLSHPPFLPFCC